MKNVLIWQRCFFLYFRVASIFTHNDTNKDRTLNSIFLLNVFFIKKIFDDFFSSDGKPKNSRRVKISKINAYRQN